ncbi:hypothetical protein GH5_02977 [Leishmania sp. Ghana 2012 LV757]|uniref:hypothetical protein n=1 Tax=Leishmania sp. Ghana 2012 LV757 TaxID=2803181 RepID=UPI001B486733|nr:hypothetical protein GH5_02977 [Leishmania sp. Ghana 2012 LV757]
MDPSMQVRAQAVAPTNLDRLQSASSSAPANSGVTRNPAPKGGMEQAAERLQPAATATTIPVARVAACPSSGVLRIDDDMRSAFGSSLLPPHLLVHPQGFRILKNASVLERNMRTYFRLPQPPNAAIRKERRRLHRTLQRIKGEEAQQKALLVGSDDGVVLDGFLLLCACKVEDPEEVTQVVLQSSQLSSSIAEDLQYFTHLTSLDLSDNCLRLGHVLPFPGLEVVHLVCNNITSLAELLQSSSSSLTTIAALDLAYNRIPPSHLGYLRAFSTLQQLDLSHNRLRALPMDLSGLAHLTHFALESNELSSPGVFYALGTMPALVEVNLSRNRLSSVPPLDAGSRGGDSDPPRTPFPSLQVMTLTANRFQHIEALRPLAALHRTLRCVAVGENPLLDRQPHRKAELQHALDEAVVDAYNGTLLPPQTERIGSAVQPETMGTWHRQTWARYIPQPLGEEDTADTDVMEATAVGASSWCHTTASIPSAVASTTIEVLEPGCPVSQSRHHREGVSPLLLTAEEYLRRCRILVQTPRAAASLLPAQPSRYFYSVSFRQSEQGARDATPLVTLPPYSEFMDIYRVLGRRRGGSQDRGRGGGVGRSYATRTAPAQRMPPRPPSRLPILHHPPTPPRTEGLASSHQVSDDEGEAESARDGKCFFLTSLNSGVVGGAAVLSRRNAPEDRRATAAAPPAATQPVLAEKLASASADTAGKAPPRTHLPRSVVSPATVNVRTAISELRAMLRKPLPYLPYGASRAKRTAG